MHIAVFKFYFKKVLKYFVAIDAIAHSFNQDYVIGVVWSLSEVNVNWGRKSEKSVFRLNHHDLYNTNIAF